MGAPWMNILQFRLILSINFELIEVINMFSIRLIYDQKSRTSNLVKGLLS